MFEFQNEFVKMSTDAVSFPPFDLLSQSIAAGFFGEIYFFISLPPAVPIAITDG
jgi:hypothetical protein